MASPLDDLSGVKLRIYCYLLQQGGPVGVRETQRALNLKTASHASYHLQKMYEDGLLEKTPQNTYLLLERFRVKSIRINVLTEYFLLRGRFWPRTVFFATYLLISLIIAIILMASQLFSVLNYYLILSTILSLAVAFFEIRRELRALPTEEN